MSFKDFIEIYMKDMEQRLKSSTVASKHWMIDLKITPFFGRMPSERDQGYRREKVAEQPDELPG